MNAQTLSDVELSLVQATRKGEWTTAKACMFDLLMTAHKPSADASYHALSHADMAAMLTYLNFADPAAHKKVEQLVNFCMEPGHDLAEMKAFAFDLMVS